MKRPFSSLAEAVTVAEEVVKRADQVIGDPLPFWNSVATYAEPLARELLRVLDDCSRNAVPSAPSSWRDMASAPKDGTAFIGYSNGHFAKCAWEPLNNPLSRYWGIDGTWHQKDIASGKGLLGTFEPTHWMPLPALPQGKET